MSIVTIDPATGQSLASFEVMSDEKLELRLHQSQEAFLHWRQSTIEERIQKLKAFTSHLGREIPELAELISKEMGKPLAQSVAELKKSQSLCVYLAENLPRFTQSEEVNISSASRSHIHHAPKGVILGVMPWNFPVWQSLRFALPALAMGNVVLLKPAPNTTGSALRLEAIFTKSFSADVFQCLVIENHQVESVLADPRVRALSFTGSTQTGAHLAAMAARYIKPSVLELGGSDAYLVLADADVELAAQKLVESRMLNNGQSCVAAKRFLVDKKIKSDFTDQVLHLMRAYVPSHPLSQGCRLGPLARGDLRATLRHQVLRSQTSGARLLLGGDAATQDASGFFYPATVLDQVEPGQAAFDEELFGPVAAIVEFSSVQEGVRLFNQSQYGLGGGIFSRDLELAESIAQNELDCGMVFINDYVKSMPELPFGGEKNSGWGRELGVYGVHEFTNVKTVVVK